jgi:dolichol-phosphate mannosyltransferase
MEKLKIDLVLPIHNEAESIEDTLTEFYNKTKDICNINFICAEDGSKDNTVEILKKLERTLPIKIITSTIRKGYSKAVVDGFKSCENDLIAFIDSDGQCDPSDFVKFIEIINAKPEVDIVFGYRNPRNDHWIRILMSSAFKLVYSLFFKVNVKDPSCPYMLFRKKSFSWIYTENLGILKQGFWWEFIARSRAHKVNLIEVPVKHRERTKGETQVYKPSKVPKIAYTHLLGLLELKKELKQQNNR